MKRSIALETACLLAAVYFASALNAPFWSRMTAAVQPAEASDWVLLAATAVLLIALFNLALTILATRHTVKPLLAVLFPLTAAVGYFMGAYGIVIDTHMVRNAFETNTAEATDLVNAGLLLHVGLFGVLPAIVVLVWPIAYRPFWTEVRRKAVIGFATLPVVVALVWLFFMDFTSLFREQRTLKYTLTPSNYLVATAGYLRSLSPASAVVASPFGADAHVVHEATAGAGPKTVTVVVVGETARADHFSLNGYARATNPELSKIAGLVSFRHVTSCGTDTAHSVPCMFSGVGRANTTSDIALRQEDLLDIAQRAGLDVLWRENQTGCKGVCLRVPTETLTHEHLHAYCDDGECHDAILLAGLEKRLAATTKDALIVLHMMGSHGPAYFKRYPQSFARFKPECKETQFSHCTADELINAYDNTILYTDHVLADLIGLLQRVAGRGIATSMIYMSDHGESLGENNLYLHGMPFALAPEVQTHVPMLVWLSPEMAAARAIDPACVAAKSDAELSHDNLFHSVLGLNDVATAVYDPALDIYATCRPKAAIEALTASAPRPAPAKPAI